MDPAVDVVIDEALDTNTEPPLRQGHFDSALAEMRPSTLEWLSRARNYVEFANQGERYQEVERFLKTREAKSYGKL